MKASIPPFNLQKNFFFPAFLFHFQQLEVPLVFTSLQNMRTRGSGSAIAVIPEKPEREKRVTLTQKRPAPEENQAPQPLQLQLQQEESQLLREEKAWLKGRLAVGLQKTRAILDVFEHDLDNDDYDFDALLELDSVEEVVAALNGSLKASVPAQVFRNVFHDDEWAELEASDSAIAAADDAALRVLRLSRQRALLWETRKVAIDLTVRDAGQAGEQSGLINECIQVMTGVLDVIGMNARGTVRRVQQVAAPSPPRALAPRQRQRQVKVVVKQKAKRVVAVVKKKPKLVEEEEVQQEEDQDEQQEEEDEMEDGDDEEQDESDEQDEVAKRARHDPEEEEQEEAVKKAKHDSNEEEEEEEEEEEVFDVDALLAQLKGQVETVMKMLFERDKGGGLVLKVTKVTLPDLNCASAEVGAALLLDKDKLSQCVADQSKMDDDDCLRVERWGTLMKWWRLANRALTMAGIFASLKSKRKKRGITLQDRYKEAVKDVKVGKVYSYPQAAVYDRLGRFLLKYPQFLCQLQLVTIADWSQRVVPGNARKAKLVDVVESRLLETEDDAFWSQPLPPLLFRPEVAPVASASVPSKEKELCAVCKAVRPGFEQLWQCSDCGCLFHEMCVGYADGAICADLAVQNSKVELETLVYCQACLEHNDLTVDDVAKGIAEVKAVAQFLNAPKCAFNLEKVDDDGLCCFRILESVARDTLGWKGGDQDAFCKAVAKAAVASAGATVKEMGKGAVDAQALKDLKRFAKDDHPCESLKDGAWKQLEIQHVLRGFVNLFPRGSVVIHIYQADGEGVGVRKTDSYGEKGKGAFELNILQWNMVQHHDRLHLKK
jgi:hypothetical protein